MLRRKGKDGKERKGRTTRKGRREKDGEEGKDSEERKKRIARKGQRGKDGEERRDFLIRT